MTPPNILWICTDQQRVDTLGCYGNQFVKTPNLDRLAAQGTLFEKAFSQSPVCTPSRAGFLTGRYPRTTRDRQNGQDIPEDEVLVTKILADSGYICGLSGKLHLSPCFPPACPEMERRIDDGYTNFHWSHYPGPGWGTHNEYWAWLEERGQTYNTPNHSATQHVQVGMPEEHHQTTWCVEKAINFIQERVADKKPWLFSVNFFDPHHAFDPPKEYLDRYMDILDEIPLPDFEEQELRNKLPYLAWNNQGAYGNKNNFAFNKMSSEEHRLIRAAYWAMCDLIDVQVGRLLRFLQEAGQADNTLIIFTSDHGELLGDHGVYLKGPFLYDCSVQVPLIISWPGRVKAQRSKALVELTDLAQTILDAIGMPHHPGMQGKSLWPLLTGKTPADHHRDDIYCEYYNGMRFPNQQTAQMTMVRDDRYKLIVEHTHNSGELYDLSKDPKEFKNLWSDAGMAAVKSDLLLKLCNRMAFTVDPLPLRRGVY